MDLARPDIKLKVCGMKHPANLKEVAALHPHYLGFIFYSKSKRFMEATLSPEEVKALPESIQRVGVFVNSDTDLILRKAEEYGLQLLQLHGDESPEQCAALQGKGYVLVKAFGLHEAFDFKQLIPYEPFVDFYLFDTKGPAYGGNGTVFNWAILEQYDQHKPFFLSGGIGLEEIGELSKLQGMQVHALDVNSRFELEPGLKDATLVKELRQRLSNY